MKRLITIVLAMALAISLLPVFAVPALAASAPKEVMLVEWSNSKDIEFVVSDVADALPDGDPGVTVNNVNGLDKNPDTLFKFHWETSIYKVSRICVTHDGQIDVIEVNGEYTNRDEEVQNARIIKYITFYYVEDGDSGMAPIPEIATIGMFGIGLVGLCGIVWFRRRRNVSQIIA